MSARLHRLAKRFQARTENTDRLQKLIAFAALLGEADFRPLLDAAAIEVGADPAGEYRLDGRWHRLHGSTPGDRGRVGYRGEWRTSRHAVRYPTASFYSHRHGGQSVTFDGWPALIDLFERGAIPAPAPATRPAPPPPPDPTAALAAMRARWTEALPLDADGAGIARRYLVRRGLAELIERADWPVDLRFHSALPYHHQRDDAGPTVLLGRHPALVAVVRTLDGWPVALHRLYLRADGTKAMIDHDGERLPARKLWTATPGASVGAAVRLWPVQEGRLIVGEGAETVAACRLAWPTWGAWSCLSAGGLEAVRLPVEAQDVLIAGDHDSRPRNLPAGAGQLAAVRLARRLRAEGRRVRIALPAAAGTDFADLLAEVQP